jgi:transposase-like protein
MPVGIKHTPEVREECRSAFCSGQYSSVTAIGKAFGVCADTLYRWRAHYNWDDDRNKLLSESKKKAGAELIGKLARARVEHFTIWTAFEQEIVRRFTRYREQNREVPLDELDVMTRIMKEAQRGKYLTGAEEATIEESVRHINVTFGGIQESIDAAREVAAQGRNGGGSDPDKPVVMIDVPTPPDKKMGRRHKKRSGRPLKQRNYDEPPEPWRRKKVKEEQAEPVAQPSQAPRAAQPPQVKAQPPASESSTGSVGPS